MPFRLSAATASSELRLAPAFTAVKPSDWKSTLWAPLVVSYMPRGKTPGGNVVVVGLVVVDVVVVVGARVVLVVVGRVVVLVLLVVDVVVLVGLVVGTGQGMPGG